MACPDKATTNGGRVIPACERNRKTWLQRTALRLRIPASRRPRHGWGIHISNPNEMTASLSMIIFTSAVFSLVRKTEQVNIRGEDFYIDFEFVLTGRFREDESPIQRFSVAIAVRRLDGQVVIDTPIKYSKSTPEFLAGIPLTGSTADFSWAVMKKVYGQEEETFGKTWDEVKHLLHDAGMRRACLWKKFNISHNRIIESSLLLWLAIILKGPSHSPRYKLIYFALFRRFHGGGVLLNSSVLINHSRRSISKSEQ